MTLHLPNLGHCVWVGSLEPNFHQLRCKAFSPASITWQRHFVYELSSVSSITPITIVNDRSFLLGGPCFSLVYSLGRTYRYINLFFIRDIHISLICLFLVLTSVKPLLCSLFITRIYIQRFLVYCSILSFKWVSIFADGRTVSTISDFVLYLSYSAYTRHSLHKSKYCKPLFFPFPISNRTLFTSSTASASLSKLSAKCSNNYILYAGSINKWTGILEFMSLFLDSQLSKEYELVICGPNNLPEPFCSTSGIHYFGLLSEQDLHVVAHNASAFISPRPNLGVESLNNFPSKLSFYLGYDAPTFSDVLPSFDPSLIDILFPLTSPDYILEVLTSPSQTSAYTIKLNNYRRQHCWHQSVTEVLSLLY